MRSATEELGLFAKEALSRGIEKTAITQAMIEAGWTPEQARVALSAYSDVTFPIPVPRPRPQLSAREAFLYLVLFTTLYMSAYHLGSLLFDLVNRSFPDPAVTRDSRWVEESMRWSVAYLVITFPAFGFVAHYIGKDVARHPIKRLSPIRRWLTYLTLFIASGALIGDLATLVYSILAGELTTRIVLKVLVVIVIAGTAFGYYLMDLRKEERE